MQLNVRGASWGKWKSLRRVLASSLYRVIQREVVRAGLALPAQPLVVGSVFGPLGNT